jgi:ORF6N domain
MELKVIQKKIFEIRGQKVMLDFDLAELYEVEARVLNQAVKRNFRRFPDDFMFQITPKEWETNRSQIVTSSKQNNSSQIVMSSRKHRGTKYLPFAFTEQGVAMLSGILNSDKAIDVNISIMRAFVMIKQFALTYNELAEKIAKLERKNNKQFKDVYEALNLLLTENEDQVDWKSRERIGYKK